MKNMKEVINNFKYFKGVRDIINLTPNPNYTFDDIWKMLVQKHIDAKSNQR